MKLKISRKAAIGVLAAGAAIMVFLEYYPIEFAVDTALNQIIRMTLTRGIGSLTFTVLLIYMGFHVHRMSGIGRQLLFALPCFAVVINNLPIIALATGAAQVVSPAGHVVWFVFECIFIGIFEETVFRGVIYLMLLEKRRSSTNQIFWTTVWSSAIFGGIHLINLLAGAGVGPTLLQVGYSFLIGGMCSVVLLKTRNIWLCALLHAIYDVCGLMLPTLGAGSWWDTPTIIITAVLAVAVAVYVVAALLRVTPASIAPIFDDDTQKTADKL